MRPRYRVLSALLVAVFLLPGALCLAQDVPEEEEPLQPLPVYSLGQQSLYISAGLMIPLFFQDFGGAVSDTNLSLGAAGSLQWSIHLDNHWLIGIELGGMFSKSLPGDFLYMLPITAKAAYIFHLFPFEIPVFLGTGMNILKFGEQAQINWILKPGFSTVWKYNMSWGFGLNVSYWWVLQPYSDHPATGESRSRMGNFLDITATAQYNF